jgi:hypothetical protein
MTMRLLALTLLACAPVCAQSFSEPVRINAGDAPINVDIGHAAPYFADIDGDGLKDLLVGQFGEGKLRIYKNVGSAKEPKFDKFEYLQAGGETAKVPTG